MKWSMANRPAPGWSSFLEHLKDRYPTYRKKIIPVCVLNDVLRDYGAKHISVGGRSWIDFDNEKRYTLFILKFGALP
jgi:hypothetical protein